MTTALLASLMLAFFPWHFDVYNLPKIFCVAAVACFWNWRRKEAAATGSDPAARLFLVVYFLALAFTMDWLNGMLGNPHLPFQGFLSLFLYWQCFRIGQSAERCAGWPTLVCFLGLMATYAAFQSLGYDFARHLHSDIFDIAMPAGNRAISTQGSPVYLASIFIIGFPIATAFVWAKKAPRSLVILLCMGLVACASKSAFLGILVSGVTYLLLRGRKERWIVPVLACLAWVGVMALRQRMSISDMERVFTWRIAWQAFLRHPWLGYGPDNFLEAFRQLRPIAFSRMLQNATIVQSQAHNEILQWLATTGIFGALAWVLLMMSIYSSIDKTMEGDIIKSAFIGLGVQAMIEPICFGAMGLMAYLVGNVSPRGKMESNWPQRIVSIWALVMSGLLLASDGLYELAQYRYVKGGDLRTPILWSLSLDPANIDHSIFLIVDMFNHNERPAARAFELSRLHPNDPVVHLLNADANAVAGDLPAAQEWLRKASEADPEFIAIKERRAAVDSLILRQSSPRPPFRPL